MNTCNTCKANKVCDHNKFGFENCNNYIPNFVMCEKCIFKNKDDFCFKNINGIGYKLVLPWDYCSYGEENDTIKG